MQTKYLDFEHPADCCQLLQQPGLTSLDAVALPSTGVDRSRIHVDHLCVGRDLPVQVVTVTLEPGHLLALPLQLSVLPLHLMPKVVVIYVLSYL